MNQLRSWSRSRIISIAAREQNIIQGLRPVHLRPYMLAGLRWRRRKGIPTEEKVDAKGINRPITLDLGLDGPVRGITTLMKVARRCLLRSPRLDCRAGLVTPDLHSLKHSCNSFAGVFWDRFDRSR
jgi:hypothetical protein